MLAFVKNLFTQKQNPSAETTPTGNVWSAAERAEFEKIYTDAAGRNYYGLKNPLKMSMKRGTEANAATICAGYGITNERLTHALAKIAEANKKGDTNAIGWWVTELQTDMLLCAEEETLFSLATTYVFDENEPLAASSKTTANDKIRRWKEDPAAASFFLDFAWKRTKQYALFSELDIAYYLKNTKELKRRLRESAPQSINIGLN